MKILQIFCLFLLLKISLFGNEIIYFMPYENKQALTHLISLINGAKENINIAIYSFTHKDLSKALKKAAQRGVSVNIIYDLESNQNNPKSTIGYLSKYKNIQTCLLEGKVSKNKSHRGHMHQKMAIIDRDVLIAGSANWSKNAFENNYETLFLTSNPQSIAKALKAYQQMFEQCIPY